MKERYLHYEKAGDQYLGRVVAGLNCSDHSFAVSPPYFDFSSLDVVKRDELEQKIDDVISKFMVGGEEVDPCLFCIFRFCFASICFHADFLSRHLHLTNRLHASPFFTQIPVEIQQLATIKFPWNKSPDTPNFTGIPPHVSLLSEMQGMREDFRKMKEDLVNSFKSELDQRGIGSDAFFDAKMIVDRMDIMERSIVQKLEARVDKFAADDGAVVSTSAAVDVEHVHDEITQVSVRASKSSAYNVFIGKGGSIKRVPQNFSFPTMSLSLLIVYWFCGDKSKHIIPLCLLCRRDLDTKTMKNYLTKMQQMMSIVKIAGTREGVWIDQPHYKWDVKLCNDLFKAIDVKYFKYPTKRHVRQQKQITWKTVLESYIEHKKVFACDMHSGTG